jgi:hypothetical protein
MAQLDGEILDPDYDTYSLENGEQGRWVLHEWTEDKYFSRENAPKEIFVHSWDYGLRGKFIGYAEWDDTKNHMGYILLPQEEKP